MGGNVEHGGVFLDLNTMDLLEPCEHLSINGFLVANYIYRKLHIRCVAGFQIP